MPILASLNAKNRSKSPFSIGMLFSIISEFTVGSDDSEGEKSPPSPIAVVVDGDAGTTLGALH